MRPGFLIRLLSGPMTTLTLLVVIGGSISTATFIESSLGTAASKSLVYNARWFELVLALFALNLILALRRWWPFRPRMSGFVLIHFAVIVILVGAALTRFLGFEGSMFIREGNSSDHIYSRENHIQLTIGDMTGSFPARLYKSGTSNLNRNVSVGDEDFRVEVTRFWRYYGEEIAEGTGGRPAIGISAEGSQGLRSGVIRQGEQLAGEGEKILYAVGMTPDLDWSPFGQLNVGVGEQETALEVRDDAGRQVELEGFTIILREFNADYRLGAAPPPVPQMSNPMVRFEVVGPDGSREERTLFPFHPEFSKRRLTSPGSASSVTVEYRVKSEIRFAGAGSLLQGVCSLGLIVSDGDGAGSRVIGAGQVFSAKAGETYKAVTGEFSVTLQSAMKSGVLTSVEVDDPDAPSAAEIQVTDQYGAVASAVVVQGIRAPNTVLMGQRVVGLGFGPIKITLPHRIVLDDFVVRTYPGSTNPVDFESRVRLFDEQSGIMGEPSRIFMNHPLTHRGFKHFQSSFDEDHLGTVLTVNYDPGKIPTYFGYSLISLGFILVFLKDLIWKPRRKFKESEAGSS